MVHTKSNKFILLENGQKVNWIELPDFLKKMRFNPYVWHRGYSGGGSLLVDLSKELKTNEYSEKMKEIISKGLHKKLADVMAQNMDGSKSMRPI